MLRDCGRLGEGDDELIFSAEHLPRENVQPHGLRAHGGSHASNPCHSRAQRNIFSVFLGDRKRRNMKLSCVGRLT